MLDYKQMEHLVYRLDGDHFSYISIFQIKKNLNDFYKATNPFILSPMVGSISNINELNSVNTIPGERGNCL